MRYKWAFGKDRYKMMTSVLPLRFDSLNVHWGTLSTCQALKKKQQQDHDNGRIKSSHVSFCFKQAIKFSLNFDIHCDDKKCSFHYHQPMSTAGRRPLVSLQWTLFCASCGHPFPTNFLISSAHLTFCLPLQRFPSLRIQSVAYPWTSLYLVMITAIDATTYTSFIHFASKNIAMHTYKMAGIKDVTQSKFFFCPLQSLHGLKILYHNCAFMIHLIKRLFPSNLIFPCALYHFSCMQSTVIPLIWVRSMLCFE